MKKYQLFLSAILALTLSGCVAVVAGGIAAGAAASAVVYDKRSSSTLMSDEKLGSAIQNNLNANPALSKQGHVSVAVYSGWVLLVGEVPSPQLKQLVNDITQTTPGIKKLFDEVKVEKKPGTLSSTHDTWITTKVKSALIGTKGLQSGQIKVVTEDGVVYLMGIVTPAQGRLAANVASQVTDVKQVVKVFEYVGTQQESSIG